MKTLGSKAGGAGSTPGQGTNSPHAILPKKKKKKKKERPSVSIFLFKIRYICAVLML